MPDVTSRESFFQEFRNRIAQGDLEQALTDMRLLSKEYSLAKSNLSTQLMGRFASLQKDQIAGTLSSDDYRVEKNRISTAALDLVGQLEKSLPVQNLPVAAPRFKTESLSGVMPAKLEKILGINNLKQIAWIEQGLKASRAVCRVLTPQGLGTGFLIAPNRVITNHHVIGTKEQAKDTLIEFNYQLQVGGEPADTVRYQLDPNAFFHTSEVKDLDFTVVAVKTPEPGFPRLDSWGTLRLNANADPVPNEHVVIVQHPNGQPKQIVLTANSVLQTKAQYLHYSTDTMPGSSGSPVFNDLWQVIAIHHAAGDALHGAPQYSNEGILMSAIRSDLGAGWPA